MSRWFEDKTVLITGASSGIGAATAREFARQGAHVVLLARRKERLETLQREIEAAGGKALALACDITDRSSVNAAIDHAIAAFGRLDVVLANAGFGVSGLINTLDTDDFRRQFETNFFGVLETVFAALPHLIAAQGRLALVGSVSGRLGTPTSSPYTSSKFAVVGLAESIYYDLAPLGVSVSCINPGFIASEIRSVNNQGKLTNHPDPVPRWLVLPAEKAARVIVRGIYRRRPEILITGHAHVMVFMARHFPRTTRLILRLTTRGQLQKLADRKK